MLIRKTYTFDAAHSLDVPEGHKCRAVHGHTYRVTVTLKGKVDERTGMVLDFHALDAEWAKVADRFDHRLLNDELTNPTAERLAARIWSHLSTVELHPYLHSVTAQEGDGGEAEFFGEDYEGRWVWVSGPAVAGEIRKC